MSVGQIVAALEQMDQEDLAEDLYDLLAFQMRATEPVRPFEEFARS